MIRRETTRLFPVLLLEPNTANAAAVASLLDAAGFEVLISESAGSALRAVAEIFFFALIVVADFTSKDCLVTLEKLRRRAPGSWMIVAAPDCAVDTCSLIHVLDAFHRRARPSF